jgi:divalent metal cation (Fe/Co/Zn/Cd) transporter
MRLEYISFVWMSVEVLGSIGVGISVGSLALIAFGGDSLVELLSAFVVAGHLKGDIGGSEMLGESVSRFGSGLLFLLLPIIGFGALYSYLAGVRPEGSLLGILIAVGAVIVMPYLWLEKRKIGQETNCLPLKIDAVESATCFFMSLSLLGGLLAEYFLGWWWADYVAACAILVFVAKEAVEAYHETCVDAETGPRER